MQRASMENVSGNVGLAAWAWPWGRCDSPSRVTAPAMALLGLSVCMGTGAGAPLCCCQGAPGAPLPLPSLSCCPAERGLCLSCSQEAIPEPKAASCVPVASHGAFVLGFGRASFERVFAERHRSPDETFHSDALCGNLLVWTCLIGCDVPKFLLR